MQDLRGTWRRRIHAKEGNPHTRSEKAHLGKKDVDGSSRRRPPPKWARGCPRPFRETRQRNVRTQRTLRCLSSRNAPQLSGSLRRKSRCGGFCRELRRRAKNLSRSGSHLRASPLSTRTFRQQRTLSIRCLSLKWGGGECDVQAFPRTPERPVRAFL